ncbi:hypothetical protein [Streptomyces sp. NRRL S-1824]|uniref:hypothetical protein n=1 Tax=Streptomyces sp. NRRL S-1824 TaxID=1463889 RepID=UPI0004CA292F|nr:hypothetical protein [Streptomyces sp. NRRL S-1824]
MTADRRAKRKLRDLNRHRGIPNRYQGDDVRAHIDQLHRTMSYADIAVASRCSRSQIRRIMQGGGVNKDTRTRLLAVTPTPRGGLFIDALGTRRRIHALQAIGHSQDTIADAASTTQYQIYSIISGQATVRYGFAQRITNAYRQLADTNGDCIRARRRAAVEGWAGPEYWDEEDFDNPDFTPAVEATPRFIALAENSFELERLGHTRQQAAERLGVTANNLQVAIGRYRKTTQQNAAAGQELDRHPERLDTAA